MRALSIGLILLFGLSLLGEMERKHCADLDAGDRAHAAFRADGASKIGAVDLAVEGSSDDADHVCSFGHCGHLLAPPIANLSIPVSPPPRIASRCLPAWRALAAPLRPPIA